MTPPAVAAPPPAPPAPARPDPRPAWRRALSFDNRFLAPFLITCILLVGNAQYRFLDNYSSPLLTRLTGGLLTTYSPTFVAILVTILTELLLGRFIHGKWPHLASAYISGISAGILIKSPELWPYVLCGMISIVSKYALRVEGRHLWNPTNFGVSALL